MPKIIMNGGDPINDCPTTWAQAMQLQNAMNHIADDREKNFGIPNWHFDCGYKLDFDGPIIRISSRFYPPKTDYGPTWTGTVTIYMMNNQLDERNFDCKTLPDLQVEVEGFLKTFIDKLKKLFK